MSGQSILDRYLIIEWQQAIIEWRIERHNRVNDKRTSLNNQHIIEWKIHTTEWQIHTIEWQIHIIEWQIHTIEWQIHTIEWQIHTIEWQIHITEWQIHVTEWQIHSIEWQIQEIVFLIWKLLHRAVPHTYCLMQITQEGVKDNKTFTVEPRPWRRSSPLLFNYRESLNHSSCKADCLPRARNSAGCCDLHRSLESVCSSSHWTVTRYRAFWYRVIIFYLYFPNNLESNNLESSVIFTWVNAPHDWLKKNLRHFFIQSEVKPIPLVTHSRALRH